MSAERRESWALDSLGEALFEAEAAIPRTAPSRQPLAIAAVALVVALIAFVTLTPAGRALAESVAKLVGIGDEPTVTHEDGGGSHTVTKNAEVVVATGTTPSGERLEITAFQGTPSTADRERFERHFGDNLPPEAADDPLIQSLRDGAESTCLVLDFPDSPSPYGDSTCSLSGVVNVPMTTPGFNDARHAQPESAVVMSALTGPTVERIKVTYESASGSRVQAPVVFGNLTEELAARIGAPHPMGEYVSYLPADLFPGHYAPAMETLEITAYGADGEIVKHIDYGPIYEKARLRNLEARCMRHRIEPAMAAGEAVPLRQIRRDCAAETER